MVCPFVPSDHGDALGAARRVSAAGDHVTAMRCYDLALTSLPEPNHAPIHYQKAAAAFAIGDQAQVERSLRASLRLAPWFGDGYFELGNSLYSAARHAESMASYRAALRQRDIGDRPMVHNNLGNVLADSGDHKGAIAEYRRGLRLAPAFPYLYNGLANALSSAGRGADAVTAIQQALRVQPSAHYARFNLGNYLRDMKRISEAKVAYQLALRAQPAEPRYVTGMGQLLHQEGSARLPEAISRYRDAAHLLSSAGAARSAPLERDLAAALRDSRR
jgi:tetratricopeptide (TPR) repeat protein